MAGGGWGSGGGALGLSIYLDVRTLRLQEWGGDTGAAVCRAHSSGAFPVLDLLNCSAPLCLPQFVPFRDYMTGGPGAGLSMAGLAREVLAEIPDQLLSYMKARGIKPHPHPSHVP